MNKLSFAVLAFVTAATVHAEPASQKTPATVLADYEAIGALLVDDKLADANRLADKLAVTAKAVAAKAPVATKAQLQAIADASKALPKQKDPKAARVSYGEMSKAVVAMLIADPALAKGHFVFECPMAPGYKKWVQASDKLANPYMGKAMPGCGMQSEWKP